ncbi:BTAD domain-containing putative transcriptional regulator [Hamadaea sp. NPDC051192]|uniref:AfsR/SARP family transcriptional regulator n=1 Tax=Hamadaea sp. NPDC051192 TaxID=3154940 RepID=UPI0034457DA2
MGPLEVSLCGGAAAAVRPQHRGVLAYLLLHANRVVTFDRLIPAIWGEAAPASARTQVHGAVSALRRTVAAGARAAVIRSLDGGYLLEAGDEDIDLTTFRATVHRAAAVAATDPANAAGLLHQALHLWRGEALADVTSEYAGIERQRLAEERRRAYEQLAEAELALGRYDTLIPRLERMIDEDPLREPLTRTLMLALYRSGRQAEALEAYEHLRASLTEQLGIQPGPGVRDLHLAILRQDAQLAGPPPPGVIDLVPAALPQPCAGFVGRAAELAALDAVPGRHSIAVVWGTAGVGKTSLALTWAHAAADRFPDGQLYADLRGFSPDTTPADAAGVLRGFLDTLGVPAHRVPSGVDAQATLFRSLLHGRRMLVVLDDARHPDQVRPLLPAAPGCFTLITSRKQLTGLVVSHGAQPVPVEPLADGEARDLLRTRIGADRMRGEPAAADEILRRCGGLPLALAVVGAHVALRPHASLAELSRRFEQSSGLGAVVDDDLMSDLRTAFEQSYQDLSPAAARLFRLLSLHPGGTVTVAAAASLAGVPAADAGRALTELMRANLLAERRHLRYALHDLLRQYANDLAASDADPAAELRLTEHYLHTAYRANTEFSPHRVRPAPAGPQPGVTITEISGRAEAVAWFAAEEHPLTVVVDRCAAAGRWAYACEIAWAVAGYQQQYAHWPALLRCQTTALNAAEAAGDILDQARSHLVLARVHAFTEGADEAVRHLTAALELSASAGNLAGQGHARLGLSWVNTDYLSRPGDAVTHAEAARDVFRVLGDPIGEGRALNCLGWAASHLGAYEQGLADCGAAQALLAQHDCPGGEALAWDSMGFAYAGLGRLDDAIACYHRALPLLRDAEQPIDEAATLDRLGDAYAAIGRTGDAQESWRQALSVLDGLDDAKAARVRAKAGLT